MNLESLIKVGMADLTVAAHSGILKTAGLGSCVGITLYDPVKKIGGLAHIMLPNSEISRRELNRAKYADTAIPEMIKLMQSLGAACNRMEGKLAGGAQMFSFTSNNELMKIGPRNVEACKFMLQKYSIPIKAQDTGANYGRTIEFNIATGILLVRSVQQGVKEI